MPDRCFGLSWRTVENYARVAERFAAPRRRVTIPFAHYADLVGLPAAAADEMLNWIEAGIAENSRVRTRWQLRNEIRDHERREAEKQPPPPRVQWDPLPALRAALPERAPTSRGLIRQPVPAVVEPVEDNSDEASWIAWDRATTDAQDRFLKRIGATRLH